MKKVIEIQKQISELRNKRLGIIDNFINKELGPLCSLLEKLGFKNESFREDIRGYVITVDHIDGLRANSFRIEYDYDCDHFYIHMTKRKSYENISGKFDMYLSWQVTEDNYKEKVSEILETMKYEYEDLIREHKLERITNG